MDLESTLPRDVDETTRRRYELTLRHKLAMDSVGLIRTALSVQRPAFERLLEAERVLRNEASVLSVSSVDKDWANEVRHSTSFDLQLRFAKMCLRFLDELDGLAAETIDLAAKEKAHA